MTVDKIAQSLEFPFPVERVWRAVSDPVELTRWFSQRAVFEPQAGSHILLQWDGYEDSVGVIETFEPPHTFAFRWRHASAGGPDKPMGPGNSTLVTFSLTATADGCRLDVVETGFAGLPAAIRAKAYQDNDGGWKTELAELVEYLQA